MFDENYFQKDVEAMTQERLQEKANADPDEETRNESTSFGIPRMYSECHFFDLAPSKQILKPRSSFFKNNKTVHEEEEADEIDHSEKSKSNDLNLDKNEGRRRMTHKLVERYNSALKLTNNFPESNI